MRYDIIPDKYLSKQQSKIVITNDQCDLYQLEGRPFRLFSNKAPKVWYKEKAQIFGPKTPSKQTKHLVIGQKVFPPADKDHIARGWKIFAKIRNKILSFLYVCFTERSLEGIVAVEPAFQYP